jgi:hypothetical protein
MKSSLVKSRLDREVDAILDAALQARCVNYINIAPMANNSGLRLTTVVAGEELAWIEYSKGQQLDDLIAMLIEERGRL